MARTSGTGTLVKLVNNAVFLCAGLLFQEGLVLATKAGLDPAELTQVLRNSSAALHMAMAAPALRPDFDDVFFSLDLATKDVSLALDTACDLGVAMPVTAAALGVSEDARGAGFGAKVFFATLRALEASARIDVPARDVLTSSGPSAAVQDPT